jgi:hypothetical protein
MVKATKHQRAKKILIVGLFVAIFSFPQLFAGFAIQSTNQPQYLPEARQEKSFLEPKNTTALTEPDYPNETNGDQNTNTEAVESKKNLNTQIEQNPTPTPPPTLTGGIYTSSNLGIYDDSSCTQPSTSMKLGTISPGESVSITFYLKSLSDKDLTLSIYTTNWNPPSASGPLALDWNLEGLILKANQVSTAILTLHVSPDIQGITTFSFDVNISGTE